LANSFLALFSLLNVVVAQQRRIPRVIDYLIHSTDTVNAVS